MIDADGARALTRNATQNEELEEARRRREREDTIRSEAFEALPEALEVINERIVEAAGKGEMSLTETGDDEPVQAALYHLIQAHYRDRRFKTSTKSERVNMGDSAAPSLVDRIVLTISWRE